MHAVDRIPAHIILREGTTIAGSGDHQGRMLVSFLSDIEKHSVVHKDVRVRLLTKAKRQFADRSDGVAVLDFGPLEESRARELGAPCRPGDAEDHIRREFQQEPVCVYVNIDVSAKAGSQPLSRR
jgi:hypothetical protein